MTGYGRATATTEERSVTAEIRTVNHRFLDVRVRTPNGLLFLEERVRRLVADKLQRGRVEVFIALDEQSDEKFTVAVDEPLLHEVRAALAQMQRVLGSDESVSIRDVLQIPQLWRIEPAPIDEASVSDAVATAVGRALAEVVAMRTVEAAALVDDIKPRLDLIEAAARSVEQRVPVIVEGARTRLLERVQTLLGDTPVQPERIAQEAALLADRADVTEELARINSHIRQMHSQLAAGGTIGRALDFLLQELNREWNTIASKANDTFVAHTVVEARSQLEKVREQVQNIQ